MATALARLLGMEHRNPLRNRQRSVLAIERLEARECPADWSPYKSSLASISAPDQVKAGEYFVFSVNAGSSAAVSVSNGDPSDFYLDGAKVEAGGGIATLYNCSSPSISPEGGAKVSISAGSHQIKVRIDDEAADSKPTLVTSQYSSYQYYKGPFVVVGGSFYGKPWSTVHGFEIDGTNHGDISLSATITSPHGVEAFPGDTLTIRLTARTTEPAATLKNFELSTFVPGGATLVPNSFYGGTPVISGNRMTWTKTEKDVYRNIISVSFRVKVQSEEQLGQIRKLLSRSTATFTTKSGFSDSRSIEKEMKIVRATQINGTVFDVVSQFPAMNSVLTNRVLEGITVKLMEKYSGRVVATTTTGADGKYEINAPKPGTYIVEYSKAVDRFSIYYKKMLPGWWNLRQRREVTIEKDRTTPLKADDLLLPVSIVNRTAVLMEKLHDLRPLIFGGWINFAVEPILPNFLNYGYDLRAVDSLISQAVNYSWRDKFTGVYTGTGEKDIFNGLIRVNAFMETLAQRQEVTLKHADTFAKATALMITTNLIPGLSSIMPKQKLTPDELATKFSVLRIKIFTMSVVLPQTMKFLFSHFNFSVQAREMISAAVFNIARYTFDKWTKQSIDDMLFEVIFTGIRTGLTLGYMKAATTGAFGVRGTQQPLNEVAYMAQRKVYAEDTNATLAYMDKLYNKVLDRTKFVEGVTYNAQQTLNWMRAITGFRDAVVGGKDATGNPIDPATQNVCMKFLDRWNQKVWPVVNKATATKMDWFKNGFKYTMLYFLPFYVLPIGLPVLELYAVDPYMEAIGKASMSGPLPESEHKPNGFFDTLWNDMANFVPLEV
jgi:hypothetical protein